MKTMENSMEWQPIETAPRDGREILATDGDVVRVCRPKMFPRPISAGDDLTMSKAGDVWEFFRDEANAPGQSWSLRPTHWMPLPPTPVPTAPGPAPSIEPVAPSPRSPPLE